jgi:hypothetical protein
MAGPWCINAGAAGVWALSDGRRSHGGREPEPEVALPREPRTGPDMAKGRPVAVAPWSYAHTFLRWHVIVACSALTGGTASSQAFQIWRCLGIGPVWSRDWYSWRLFGPEPVTAPSSRSLGAIAPLACVSQAGQP